MDLCAYWIEFTQNGVNGEMANASCRAWISNSVRTLHMVYVPYGPNSQISNF